MYFTYGKFCFLEELTTENDKELFELMKKNKDEYRFLISDESIPETYEEFQERLNIWFTHDRNYQFLVRKKGKDITEKGEIVGTIFFYGWDKERKTVKMSAYFIPEARKTSLIAESLGLAINFALKIMKVEKVEFDVYEENKEMLQFLQKERELKKYINKLGESKSKVNPERTVINFEISLKGLKEIDERLREFYKIKPR
jgi:RimJ/RimL family protein N-acetyltransferase